MKTRTIGEILREEREFHRFTIDDLAKRTRIRTEYLVLLEDNQFEQLPAATFVKGYIKTYGQVFGFAHKPLLAMLRRDFKESARGQLVPREFIKPVLKRKAFWTPITTAILVLAALFLTFTVYVAVGWYNLQKPPMLEVTAPLENSEVAAQVIVEGRTLPDAVITVNAQPVALQVDGSFTTETFLSREGINTITVKSTDRRGKSNTVQRTVRVKY